MIGELEGKRGERVGDGRKERRSPALQVGEVVGIFADGRSR